MNQDFSNYLHAQVNMIVMDALSQTDIMTIGAFVLMLNALPQDTLIRFSPLTPIIVNYEDGNKFRHDVVPAFLDSYRGFYDQCAIVPIEESDLQLLIPKNPRYKVHTVGSFLGLFQEALAGKVFHGWKGGDYVYDISTPLWASDRGTCSSIGVVGIELVEGIAYILTGEIDV